MTEFHFLRPWWLIALLPALFLITVIWRHRMTRSSWQDVLDHRFLEKLWLDPPDRRSGLPVLLLGLGWLLAVLALAGPTWERQPEPVWQSHGSKILVLDLSSSMNAVDLAPSRLERARFKIKDILAKTNEERTGLVVFAGGPHVLTPLTEDSDTIINLLNAVSTDIIPVQGDVAATALKMAGNLLKQAGVARGNLVLLSDGFSDPAAVLAAAKQLRENGHRVSVLAVGTAQGAPVSDSNSGVFEMARLDTAPLRELARAGGGAFSMITADDTDLDRVLLRSYGPADVQEKPNRSIERWVEKGPWLLPLLVLLGVSGFRRGWLAALLVLGILPAAGQAFEWRDLWLRPDQQAARELNNGRAEEAARQFTDPAWRAMALHEAGDYQGAAESFAKSQGIEASYNRGNSLARSGQLAEAADAYREVLDEAPDHLDARANLALVEELLSQQKREKQQQQGGEREGKNGDDRQSSNRSKRETDRDGQRSESESQTHDVVARDSDDAKKSDAKREDDGEDKTDARSEMDQQMQDRPAENNQQELVDRTNPQYDGPQAHSPSLPSEGEDEIPLSESELALDQWLRQIPDDPSGLLRRKFLVEHLRRQQVEE